MHREHLVVSRCIEDLAIGASELESDKECLDTTNDEEEHCYGAIHDADLLVVNGEDP